MSEVSKSIILIIVCVLAVTAAMTIAFKGKMPEMPTQHEEALASQAALEDAERAAQGQKEYLLQNGAFKK